jgi:hypothetical protein
MDKPARRLPTVPAAMRRRFLFMRGRSTRSGPPRANS